MVATKRIEIEALRHEEDKGAGERMKKLEEEVAELSKEMDVLIAQWNEEKEVLERVSRTKKELEVQ